MVFGATKQVTIRAPFGGGVKTAEEAFYSLETPIRRVTAWDTAYPLASVEGWHLRTMRRVVEAARRTATA